MAEVDHARGLSIPLRPRLAFGRLRNAMGKNAMGKDVIDPNAYSVAKCCR